MSGSLVYWRHMSAVISWLTSHWVDLAIVCLLASYGFDGVRKGLALAGLEVAGFFLAMLGAIALYAPVGRLLTARFAVALPFAKAIGFFAVWAAIEFVYPFAANFIYKKIPERFKRSRWNKWGGSLPAILDGSLTAALLLSMVVALPMPGAVKKDVFDSRIGSFLVRRTEGLERTLDAAFGGAVKQTLTFLTVKPQTGETVNLGFSTMAFAPAPEIETRMFDLVNAERVKAGVKPLKYDPAIVPVARAHAADMFTRGYFSHVNPDSLSPSDRADAAEVEYRIFGENLAYAPDLSLAHQGLMNSPGHRENILRSEFTRIGIGVQDGGVYGLMFVQNFAR